MEPYILSCRLVVDETPSSILFEKFHMASKFSSVVDLVSGVLVVVSRGGALLVKWCVVSGAV
eukprot:323498-Heterocapsa_arctica.AAC.1